MQIFTFFFLFWLVPSYQRPWRLSFCHPNIMSVNRKKDAIQLSVPWLLPWVHLMKVKP